MSGGEAQHNQRQADTEGPLDAEMLRDYTLATSGLLVRRVGGPSVKPYQPDGVWEAVAMPNSDTSKYQRDSGDALYRRSLYTFWKRTAPPAAMDIFNAPSRENCTVRRERTNTPLQALAALNDPQFTEAARALAEVALRQAKGDPQRALAAMAEKVLLRPLTLAEAAVISATAADLESQFGADPAAVKSYLAVGDRPMDPTLPGAQVAALALVANQLANLDEALSK